MTTTQELHSIFGDYITVDGTRIAAAHLRYSGDDVPHIVWGTNGSTPFYPSDDEYEYAHEYVDVDIYTPRNYQPILRAVKELMTNNEWEWESDSPEMYEEDTKLFHITATFKKERYLLNG